MYRCSAPKSNKKTVTFIAALYLTALALFFIGNSVPAYGIIPQAIAVIIFSFAVLFSAKKLITSYDYIIEREGDEYIFKVVETRGKQQTVVCNLKANTLVSATKLGNGERAPHNIKYYTYVLDIFHEGAYLLHFEDDGGAYVLIAPDEKMVSILGEFVKASNESAE